MEIKNYVFNARKNELVVGSLIIVILTFLGNLFSYLFQFFMARMLGPTDYVVVAVITSILGLFAIPSLAIQTVISKNTTELKVRKQESKIMGLMNSSLKKMFILSLIAFVLYSLFAVFLSYNLGIEYWYFIAGGIFIFAAFTYPVLLGITQGLKKFKQLGINFFLNCFIKFISGVAFVFIGFKIYGAIMGFLFGIFFAFLLLFYEIRKSNIAKTEKYDIRIFSRQNIYPMTAMLIIVLIYSLDVIFAKFFFSSEIAGKYSVISLIGKTILFAVSSIGTAMFPINTERFTYGANTGGVFKKSMILSLIICSLAVIFFYLFPNFTVNNLFGAQYVSFSNILVYISIGFSFCALLYMMILNAISKNNIGLKEIITLLLFLILEVILFVIFNSNIELFSKGFMISNIIAFVGGYFILRK